MSKRKPPPDPPPPEKPRKSRKSHKPRKRPPVASLPEKVLRKLAKPVPEKLREVVAAVPEKLRDWIDSAAERELRAIALQLPQPNDLTRPQLPKRKRKPGAGAPKKLTPEEKATGGEFLRDNIRKRPTLRGSRADMLALLHDWLKTKRRVKAKRNVVSDNTLIRDIIRPVLNPSAK